MDELYMLWEEEVETGITDEEFEDWYAGKCSDAFDRLDMER